MMTKGPFVDKKLDPPVRSVALEQAPRTEDERKLLRAACKAIARKSGKTGKHLTIETERIYQASLEQAGRKVQVVKEQPRLIVPARGVGLIQPAGGIIRPPQRFSPL